MPWLTLRILRLQWPLALHTEFFLLDDKAVFVMTQVLFITATLIA
jgi:hypothetical protein